MSHCKNSSENSCRNSLSDCGLLLLLLLLAVVLLVFGPGLGALIATLILAVIYITTKLCYFC